MERGSMGDYDEGELRGPQRADVKGVKELKEVTEGKEGK